MSLHPDLNREYQIALKEVGEIKPWWSEEDNMYVFEHDAYPVVYYADADPEVVKERYLLVLKDFINIRLNGELDETVDKATSGRGGYRPGAGRPKGKVTDNVRAMIPRRALRIMNWLKADPSHYDQVEALITTSRHNNDS